MLVVISFFVGGLLSFLIGKLLMNYKIQAIQNEFIQLKAKSLADQEASLARIEEKSLEYNNLKNQYDEIVNERIEIIKDLATQKANYRALEDRLNSKNEEIETLNKKLTTEFENLANKIFESKTQKMTELNKESMKSILDPLGVNLKEFKDKVNEVYEKEARERFSLGEKVKELAALNVTITEETRNLTKALKGESKTQGRWGEVILETILEKSGLRKGEEYFMEYQLFDANGNPLRSEVKGKKMRPDAMVMYPDNRHIIVDSKVSLNAFIRFTESEDIDQQKIELDAHVFAIKGHINELSKKSYDDYDKTLDFVMMFIPNEPAYITAVQAEPELWNYAYDRRILLISPTNLIATLKLMVDLWKREYQNKNAQAIAERGAKLYDKFVGFIENLSEVGKHLDKADYSYKEAFKQLSTGNDNLVAQVTKLKSLGVKNKKSLPAGLIESGLQSDNLLDTN